MPLDITPVPKGYVVETDTGKKLSKKPLSLAKAKKQRVAVAISEAKAKDIPVSEMFGNKAPVKKRSAWIEHLMKVRADTGLSLKEAMKKAKETYKK